MLRFAGGGLLSPLGVSRHGHSISNTRATIESIQSLPAPFHFTPTSFREAVLSILTRPLSRHFFVRHARLSVSIAH